MNNNPNFKPLPLFRGKHKQTVGGCVINFTFPPKSKTTYLLLPDQDMTTMEVATPPKVDETAPIVVMIHGLCGSHNSPYLVRLSKKLYQEGIRSVRLNMRGCGSSKGLARYMYHSQSSSDVALALKRLRKDYPNCPLYLIGFSMGGNLALKVAGELCRDGETLLDHVIAVSPPARLATSSYLMGQNRFYERHFVNLLTQDARFRQRLFPSLPQVNFRKDMTLREFDESFTAPHMGHSSAMEYYEASSSLPVIPHIEIPCEILYSMDDPIIDPFALDNLDLSSYVRIYKTENGGHMGFLGTPGSPMGFRWMDSVLFSWLDI